MCSSPRTCDLLGDYLSLMNRRRKKGEWGRRMMEKRLRLYLWWKAKLNENKKEGRDAFRMPSKSANSHQHNSAQQETSSGPSQINEKLKKKDEQRKEKIMNRRRVRGGAPTSGRGEGSKASQPTISKDHAGSLTEKEREKLGILAGEGDMRVEAENIAQL